MTPQHTEADLTRWIAKNRMRFLFNSKHYTPDYVSWLARMNGFDAEQVYRRFSHFEYALALANAEHAAIKHANKTTAQIFLINNPIDLSESWEDLGKFLTQGKTFDEAA